MTKGKKLSRALPKWITTGSITGGVWTFEQADGIAVLTDEIEQIGGLKNHRGGILIWMDADEPRSFQKGSFQKKRSFSEAKDSGRVPFLCLSSVCSRGASYRKYSTCLGSKQLASSQALVSSARKERALEGQT